MLLDLDAGEVVARGLSMPHSPRWYAGRLWVLHSGTGGLGTIDSATGHYEEVVALPGFTRGLDFYGDTKTVDVHIRWLREKIEEDPSSPKYVQTVRGFGYRMGA